VTSRHTARHSAGQSLQGGGLGMQVWVLTMRSLRGAFGDPRLVFFGLLQPVVLLLLFSQVFRSLVTLPSVAVYRSYVNYLMPATLINIAMTTAMSSGVGLMAEIYTGFVGRLRAMPISLFSVLLARTLADAIRLAAQLVVVAGAATVILHFRPNLAGIIAAVGLSVVIGWGLGWVFVAIATWQRRAEVMQAVSFIVMFPLMFSSSAYMPVDSMPGWLRAVSKVNPLTYAIDAARAITFDTPAGTKLAAALGLAAATAAFGALVSARNFRRAR